MDFRCVRSIVHGLLVDATAAAIGACGRSRFYYNHKVSVRVGWLCVKVKK